MTTKEKAAGGLHTTAATSEVDTVIVAPTTPDGKRLKGASQARLTCW